VADFAFLFLLTAFRSSSSSAGGVEVVAGTGVGVWSAVWPGDSAGGLLQPSRRSIIRDSADLAEREVRIVRAIRRSAAAARARPFTASPASMGRSCPGT
jgi:hypothetical protein